MPELSKALNKIEKETKNDPHKLKLAKSLY